MAINLRELQSDLSWKDAASSTEGITPNSINYLCHLMNGNRLVKNSKWKREQMEVEKWDKRWSPPFPCCPVNHKYLWKKTLIENKASEIEIFKENISYWISDDNDKNIIKSLYYDINK